MSEATLSAIAGASWNPVAPAPTITTRLPVRSTSWSHSAVWNAGPSKLPGTSGTNGRFIWPTAATTARAVSVEPSSSSTDHVPAASSHVAPTTSVEKRVCSPRPCRSKTRWKYACTSGCRGKNSVQWSAGSKL